MGVVRLLGTVRMRQALRVCVCVCVCVLGGGGGGGGVSDKTNNLSTKYM